MKIYTKTGDAGTTGLFSGPRVAKNDPRIEAYGSVDELNSILGLTVASMPEEMLESRLKDHTIRTILESIQADLFNIGGELATPDPDGKDMRLLHHECVHELESYIDQAETELEPLQQFILPGGNQSASFLHLARTVCRRAERQVVGLIQQPNVANYDLVMIYLNRLSDFLFVLARLVNHRCGMTETPWSRPRQSASPD